MSLASPAFAEDAPSRPASQPAVALEVMSLRLMLDKGVITQAEYDAAVTDLVDSSGARAGDTQNIVLGKWSASVYGFFESDYITDSTQSFTDLAGAALVAHPGSYAASHPRTQWSLRNTRIGLRLRAPETRGVRASARLETDLVGDWAAASYTGSPGQPTESQFFTSPGLRVRHAFVKLETPVVDVLAGQTWHLFGWQPVYQPNVQGVPGELFSRTPQVRLSKTLTSRNALLDVAVAVMRPPQRDSALPEGEAAIHFAATDWTGVQTLGATGVTLAPASITVSGDLRGFSVANYPTGGTLASPDLKSTHDISRLGGAIALDTFIPIIPASEDDKGNALSFLGEIVYGQGMGDLYAGLTSGLSVPAMVPVPSGSPAGTASTTPYNPQIDPGYVMVDAQGNVSVIQWQTFRVGLQYTLPGLDGKLWVAANYANVSSPNAPSLATAATAPSVRNALNWFNVYVLGEVTPAIHLGLDYELSADRYCDGQVGRNHRVMGAAYYVF